MFDKHRGKKNLPIMERVPLREPSSSAFVGAGTVFAARLPGFQNVNVIVSLVLDRFIDVVHRCWTCSCKGREEEERSGESVSGLHCEW